MSGMPATGLHSIMLKSSLEFPAGGAKRMASLDERALAKPPTLFQPHAQPVSQMTPPRPQPLEEEEGDGSTGRPSPSKSQPRRMQAQVATQISVSSRPRQWLPGQHDGSGNTLLLSPRESSSILAAARVVGEHGTSRLNADGRIQTGKQESALQILKAEQLENARIMAVLKAREEEIDSLHELLWCSEVAPSQGELSRRIQQAVSEKQQLDAEMYREQLISHGITPCRVPVQGVSTRPRESAQSSGHEDEKEGLSARLLALEQQLVKYAKIIREQQRTSELRQSPFDAELEQQKAELHRKSSILAKMEEEMAARDDEIMKLKASLRSREGTLTERQSEIALKGKEIEELRLDLGYKDRCISWFRDLLASKGFSARLPSEVEMLYSYDDVNCHQEQGSRVGEVSGEVSDTTRQKLEASAEPTRSGPYGVAHGVNANLDKLRDMASLSEQVQQWSGLKSGFVALGSSISFSIPDSTDVPGDDDGKGADAVRMENGHTSPAHHAKAMEPSPQKSRPLPPPAGKITRRDGPAGNEFQHALADGDHTSRGWAKNTGADRDKSVAKSDWATPPTRTTYVLESGGSTPSSARRSGVVRGGVGAASLPSGDWDAAKAEVREQMRQLKSRTSIIVDTNYSNGEAPAARGELDPRQDGVASCKLARMRHGLKPAPLRHDTNPDVPADEIVTM